MPDLRSALAGRGVSVDESGSSTTRLVITVLAILVVVGLLPAIVVGVGAAAVSTATLAVAWLIYRRVTG